MTKSDDSDCIFIIVFNNWHLRQHTEEAGRWWSQLPEGISAAAAAAAGGGWAAVGAAMVLVMDEGLRV